MQKKEDDKCSVQMVNTFAIQFADEKWEVRFNRSDKKIIKRRRRRLIKIIELVSIFWTDGINM